MTKINTKWMVKVGMLSAVSVVLMLFEFPLPFIAPPFYELDFSEVPVLIGTFALGPLAGVVIEFIKVLLNLLVNGTITGGVGEFANFLVGACFVLPAGIIYKQKKTKIQAVIGMLAGTVIMVIAGVFVNAFLLIPAYGSALGIPMEAFVGMGSAIHSSIDSLWKLVLLCVAPFNALKCVIVSLITALIYKPLRRILK
ncbi:MAG: ECF transporter S component [Clostridia bacterium]|nr:ECF transporter S component [Clostridia bacterium]